MLAVARALSGNVRLLLLDEPFEGLAPTIVQELFSAFDQLRKQVSILIVEHNLDLVLALADRVFALDRGAVFHTLCVISCSMLHPIISYLAVIRKLAMKCILLCWRSGVMPTRIIRS